jgi:hypothetical protein
MGGLRHSFVGTLAGMQVVTTVIAVGKRLGISRAANSLVEINAAVEDG